MNKIQLSEEFRRMQKLAGIITENEMNNNSKKTKLKQWVVTYNAGGYGPDKDDEKYDAFTLIMKNILNNAISDFNTSMSPDVILEDFIEEAISIIGDYTMDYYGDSTSFSPEDIKAEFYEFMEEDN